jgi:hypothetical protein
VCGPPSVTDAVNATQRRDLDGVFQVDQLAGRAADIQLAVFLHDGAAGGIIATIFEAPEAIEDQGHDGFRVDVTYDSAREILLAEAPLKSKMRAAAPAIRLEHWLEGTMAGRRRVRETVI